MAINGHGNLLETAACRLSSGRATFDSHMKPRAGWRPVHHEHYEMFSSAGVIRYLVAVLLASRKSASILEERQPACRHKADASDVCDI